MVQQRAIQVWNQESMNRCGEHWSRGTRDRAILGSMKHPPRSEDKPHIVPAWYPADQNELAVLKIALDTAGLEYLVENENYYSAAGGARLAIGDSQLRILVRETDLVRAQEVIRVALA